MTKYSEGCMILFRRRSWDIENPARTKLLWTGSIQPSRASNIAKSTTQMAQEGNLAGINQSLDRKDVYLTMILHTILAAMGTWLFDVRRKELPMYGH